METKHTPGPWEEYAGNIRTVEANEKYGDGYRAEFRRRPIADVVNMRGQEEMNKANARLIAAAPDQIAELIRIEARVAASMPTKHDDLTAASVTFTGADLAKLRAIIAKATK